MLSTLSALLPFCLSYPNVTKNSPPIALRAGYIMDQEFASSLAPKTRGATTQMTLAKGLEIVKTQDSVPQAISAWLESELTKLWERIRAHPETYIMTKDEFALFNYYRSRYKENSVAQLAVMRFWNQYKRTVSLERVNESPETLTRASSAVPPPGFLEQRSNVWQHSLLS